MTSDNLNVRNVMHWPNVYSSWPVMKWSCTATSITQPKCYVNLNVYRNRRFLLVSYNFSRNWSHNHWFGPKDLKLQNLLHWPRSYKTKHLSSYSAAMLNNFSRNCTKSREFGEIITKSKISVQKNTKVLKFSGI